MYKVKPRYCSLYTCCRFCNAKYNTDMGDMDNPFIHLTNVAIQKHNQDYNSKHGGKWHIKVSYDCETVVTAETGSAVRCCRVAYF